MAPIKQKPAENPNEKGGAPTEPQKAPDAVQKEASEQVTKKTSGMKLEVLKGKMDPDAVTTSRINNLDVRKSAETPEQKEGQELLEFVTSTTLLGSILKSGQSVEVLKNIENLKNINIASLTGIKASEQAAFKKLQEIAAATDKDPKSIGAQVAERWPTMVDRAKEIYGIADGGITGKIKSFVAKNPELTAIIAVAAAAGLTYAIYKMVKPSTQSNGEKSAMDTILGTKWSKRIKYGAGTCLGLYVMLHGVAYLAENEALAAFIKEKTGISLTGNRISQIAILLKQGKYSEIAKVLVEGGDDNYDAHRKNAEKITQETGTKVEPETLKQIGKLKYEDFMSIVSQGMSAIPGVLSQVPGIKNIPGVTSKVQAGNEEQAIRKYFEAHKTAIDHFKNSTSTIDDVLKKLEAGGKTPAEEQAAPTLAIEQAISKIADPEKKSMTQEIVKDLAKIIPAASIMKIITEAQKNHIDIKSLEETWTQQKTAHLELQNAIQNNADAKTVAEKAGKLFELNDRLGDESNKIMDEIMSRHGWTETQLLAVTHLPKFTTWFRQPAWKKEYGTYLVEKYIRAPLGLAQKGIDKVKGVTGTDIIGRQFKTGAPAAEIDKDLESTKKELEDAKKTLTETEAQLVTKSDDEMKREVAHAKSRVEVLEKDVKIHETRKTITELEKKLANVKASNGTLLEVAAVERDLQQNQSLLSGYKRERLKFQGNYLVYEIAERKHIFTKEFGVDGKKAVFGRRYIEQMDTLQDRIAVHRKQINDEIASKIMEAEKLDKGGKEIKAVLDEINELRATKVHIDIGAVNTYQELTKSWKNSWNLYHAMMGGGSPATGSVEKVMKEEKNDLQRLWSKIMGAQPDAAKSMSGGVIHTMKGKLLFYVPFMVAGSAINLADKRESEDWSKGIEQAIADTTPFVSTYSDFYSAAKGEELITKRKLDAKDRTVRALFGTGSVLCDATEFAGVFMKARAVSGAYKEARATSKSIDIGKAIKEGKTIDSIEALREMEKTGHWAHKVALYTSLGVATASIIYMPVSTIELNPETKEVLGNMLQETGVEPPKLGNHPTNLPLAA